jgi:hypothetical protein
VKSLKYEWSRIIFPAKIVASIQKWLRIDTPRPLGREIGGRQRSTNFLVVGVSDATQLFACRRAVPSPSIDVLSSRNLPA